MDTRQCWSRAFSCRFDLRSSSCQPDSCIHPISQMSPALFCWHVCFQDWHGFVLRVADPSADAFQFVFVVFVYVRRKLPAEDFNCCFSGCVFAKGAGIYYGRCISAYQSLFLMSDGRFQRTVFVADLWRGVPVPEISADAFQFVLVDCL